MPVLKTLAEPGTKARFRSMAKSRGLSESELLRAVILAVTGEDNGTDQPIEPDAEKADTARMTVRMPRFLMEGTRARAKSKGMDGKPMKLYRGVKSKSNNDSGYEGRIGIYEVLQMNDKIARIVLEHHTASDIERQALEDGMMLMKQDGYLKALDGITTIEEVLRVAQV